MSRCQHLWSLIAVETYLFPKEGNYIILRWWYVLFAFMHIYLHVGFGLVLCMLVLPLFPLWCTELSSGCTIAIYGYFFWIVQRTCVITANLFTSDIHYFLNWVNTKPFCLTLSYEPSFLNQLDISFISHSCFFSNIVLKIIIALLQCLCQWELFLWYSCWPGFAFHPIMVVLLKLACVINGSKQIYLIKPVSGIWIVAFASHLGWHFWPNWDFSSTILEFCWAV